MIALSRRTFLAQSSAAFLALNAGITGAAELSEDGLYQQPWFLQSFLDLREDFQTAHANGKTFAVLWELKGCPYCKLLHTVNFANAKIADYAKQNFDILQLNLIGARPVTDFDGAELPEKALAERHQIEGTPTLQFFIADDANGAIEAGRTKYLEPAKFLGMLRFVREKAYEKQPFEDWLRANPQSI